MEETWEEELGLVSWWKSRSVSWSAEPQQAGQPGGTKERRVGDKVEESVEPYERSQNDLSESISQGI